MAVHLKAQHNTDSNVYILCANQHGGRGQPYTAKTNNITSSLKFMISPDIAYYRVRTCRFVSTDILPLKRKMHVIIA